MLIPEEDYLAHYGTLRRSGRYPWGSGGHIEWHGNKGLYDLVKDLRSKGIKDTDIIKGLNLESTTELRALYSIGRNEKKAADIARVQKLAEKQYSKLAISRMTGIPDATVRSYLKEGAADKADALQTTAQFLRDQIAEKDVIQVGTGVEASIAVPRNRLDTALAILKEEGYKVINVQTPQLGVGGNQKSIVKVLAKPGIEYLDIKQNMDMIKTISGYSEDGGRGFLGILPPISVDSKRIKVVYKEDGGDKLDGVMYVRPGVKDLSLGGARYAQVRVAVDGTHYLKGMAIYKDDLPPGVDLVFNTNKKNTGNKLDAMKDIKSDPENPFGSTVRQIGEKDERGNITKLTSAMNIVNTEENWAKWSKSLSSQTLSKQSPKLAKTQLDQTYERKRNELNEILALTNPAVRKTLLSSFAESTDTSAVHLEAAALPRTSWHAILPFNSLKASEVYAPTFKDGETVALIRFPHGGTFEIPVLTVNNKNREARAAIGPQAKAAIGINYKVAERLSGADFDGDAVLVIPNNDSKIKTSPALEGLKKFDPKNMYPAYEGMKVMDKHTEGVEMGNVSNLITDMTLKSASHDEIARAIRHSMVVIDAKNHRLNYKQSAIDNGIRALKVKYQTTPGKRPGSGANTLISRAGARIDVPERRLRRQSEGGPIDKETGEKQWVPTGKSWEVTKVNKRTGVETTKTVKKMIRSEKLAETKDAHELSSGTTMENIYADHSNRLKALANTARKAYVSTETIPYSPSARKIYADEVKSLNAKLNRVVKNRPLERQAQIIGHAKLQARRQSNPEMTKEEEKKVQFQALEEARRITGAQAHKIHLSDREWEAIQQGAITNNKLTQILAKADLDRVKELATPRKPTVMTSTVQRRAEAMLNSGYTLSEIAEHLGINVNTLKSSVSSST